MALIVLVTGGSKNGKSRIAEDIIGKYDIPKFYIATMEPFGEEAAAAIARHREIRAGKGFETIEKYTGIDEITLTEGCAVLLECAINLCANEMFSARCVDPVENIIRGVKKLSEKARVLVIVTGQVGGDGVTYAPETMDYMKKLGQLNWRLADIADVVIEAVFGIPNVLKGELACTF